MNLKRVKNQKMIVLNKNATTIFVATLWEKTTLTGTYYYLFQFTSAQTKVDYYTIIANISTNIDRYNMFSFVEGVSDAINGKLILGKGGFYSYKAFEQVSSTNLDPTGLTEVESGKMRLLDSSELPDFTQHSVSPTTNIVYNPS